MATLSFKGKTFVQNHHLSVKYHQLVPKKDKSLTDKISLNDNLILHGDNLKALKALLPTYAGKVKCIYIDPPYNTGNERWVYNDNVNSPMMQEWLGKIVDREDLTRHDKWLCMMMPRLKLLRELLADDGVIFVSIDDNEIHHLRMLMDEVFGDGNFVTNIIWQKKTSPQNDAKYFSDNHDFIVVYAKRRKRSNSDLGFSVKLLERLERHDANYTNPDNDPRGPWMRGDFSVKTYSEEYDYEMVLPSGRKVKPPRGRCWMTSRERYKELIRDNRIWFGKDGDSIPAIKRFLSEVKQGITPLTIWFSSEVGSNSEARRTLKEIFSEVDLPFENPKPVPLVNRILKISTDKDSIILDSFAGSGTTAHAVLDLNKEDEGNRKFILVECEDYADKITAERVRRVIKGVPNTKDERLKDGLGGTFSYFELGEPIEMESILEGDKIPSYLELARYVFYTATGEEFDPTKVNEEKNFIGESKEYEVYLFYKPDIEYLKSTALTLDRAKGLGHYKGKKRLVFAPSKYLDTEYLLEYRIDYCQLPFEIYKLKE
ncbi:MAG: site-specific DNA-methyltransferase [bacterium]|nr:site-specific DNA-methyltransferase [bacterium]